MPASSGSLFMKREGPILFIHEQFPGRRIHGSMLPGHFSFSFFAGTQSWKYSE